MEPPPSPPPDDGPSPGVRDFWTAFVACVGPLVLLTMATVAGGDASYLLFGGLLALLVDVSFLILAIARLFDDGPGRWGTLLGVLAGALVGFGGCAALIGVV